MHNIENIVHRDIKPENLLVDEFNVLKIADFGLSEMIAGEDIQKNNQGTKFFLAPEVWAGSEYSAKGADIWAMAVTLFFIHTQKLPFKSTNQTQLKEEIINYNFDGSELENKDFADLLTGLFQLNPDKRASLREMMSHKWITDGGKEPLAQFSDTKAMEITEKDMQAAIKRSKIMTNIGIAVKLKLKLNKSRSAISKKSHEEK